MKKISNLIIIGNGLDLHHCIKSNYADFYYSNYFSDEIKNMYDIMTENFNQVNTWFDFEEEYKNLIQIEVDILGTKGYTGTKLGLTKENMKIFYPRVNCVNYIFQKISQQFEKYLTFAYQFAKNNMNWKVDRNLNLVFAKADTFINFNYTKTLLDIYGIDINDVIFPHGALHIGETIIGHSNFYGLDDASNYGFQGSMSGTRDGAMFGNKNLQRLEMWNKNAPISMNTMNAIFDKPFSEIYDDQHKIKYYNQLNLDFDDNLSLYIIGHGLQSDVDLLSKIPARNKHITIFERPNSPDNNLVERAKNIFNTQDIKIEKYEWV